MTIGNPPPPGPNSVPDYLVPGVPFLTSSTLPVSGALGYALPFVSRDVVIRNTGAGDLLIGVSKAGTNPNSGNCFSIPTGQFQVFEWRTTTIFLSSSAGTTFSLSSGLTLIPARNFPLLTASNGYFGVG